MKMSVFPINNFVNCPNVTNCSKCYFANFSSLVVVNIFTTITRGCISLGYIVTINSSDATTMYPEYV